MRDILLKCDMQVDRQADGAVGAEQRAAGRGADLLQPQQAALPGPALLHRHGIPPHLCAG